MIIFEITFIFTKGHVLMENVYVHLDGQMMIALRKSALTTAPTTVLVNNQLKPVNVSKVFQEQTVLKTPVLTIATLSDIATMVLAFAKMDIQDQLVNF